MLSEQALARRVVPFTLRLASAMQRSRIEGFFSSDSSTSNVASSDTWRPIFSNRFWTFSRISSETSKLRPFTPIRIWPLLVAQRRRRDGKARGRWVKRRGRLGPAPITLPSTARHDRGQLYG